MLAVPALTAVTSPELEFTVATAVLVLLQLPPVPVVLKVAVADMQSGDVPLTVPALAFALTVSVLNADLGALQPVFTV